MTAAPQRPRLPRPWRSLRGRLLLAAAAGLITAAVIFVVVAGGLIQSQSRAQARKELDRQAVAVAKIISNQAWQAYTEGREPRFVQPANLAALVGPGTEFFYSGASLTPGSEQTGLDFPAVAARSLDYGVLERDGVQRIDFTAPGADGQREGSAAPVTLGQEVFGAILLSRPRGDQPAAWPDVAPRVLMAAGIGLGVALLLALLLTARITRPLNAMQRAVHRVAEGDLRTALGSTGTRELDQLASDFNVMVRRLAERDGETREFLMRVTHDLRTPLTAIRGHSAALADGIVPEHERPRSLAAIEGEAARLETLVADLLDLARLDARRFKLDLARVRPGGALDRAFDAMRAEATARGLAYERAIEPLGPVLIDEGRVQQIVGNLIDNAIHWTPPGGTVRLEGRPLPDGGFAATVSDTGPGIEESDQERIFDPFQSEETPDGRRGSGLGLAISRQLARTLGGDLRVESRRGAGSRFILELPGRAA
ncbi:MAG: ATP-binding protein [Thermoleophilia bacterium]